MSQKLEKPNVKAAGLFAKREVFFYFTQNHPSRKKGKKKVVGKKKIKIEFSHNSEVR